MAQEIRLADIAARAGVSLATVSRVLNNNSSVAQGTRAKVLTAVDALGYSTADKLVKKDNTLIGLIMPELTNPIFPQFAQHLSSAMAVHRYVPLLGTLGPGTPSEDMYVDAMLRQNVAGIVFVSGMHASSVAPLDTYEELKQAGIPFITMNGPNPALDVPSFSIDENHAISRAIQHLASQGHTRIGFASGQLELSPAKAKSDAFAKAMKEILGVANAPQIQTFFTVEGGQAATEQLYAKGCTAVICASDLMALGAIQYCTANRLKVPDDLSVIGFDDSPLMTFTNPPLTTIRQPVQAMCNAAVDTMITLISGGVVNIRQMNFPAELIVRESTYSPMSAGLEE